MAYEKGDFDAAYGFYAVDPVTRIRYARAQIPEFPGEQITLRLHYHPLIYRREATYKAQRLVDKGLISKADSLVIVGGAFGWLGEALIDLTGCAAVSVDVSDYVQSAKDSSPDDDLIESIRASGYDETKGVGLFLFNRFTDPSPRASITVLKEILDSNRSRNKVRNALPRNPTRIITEEVWQIISQADKDNYTAAAASFGIPMTHIIDGSIS